MDSMNWTRTEKLAILCKLFISEGTLRWLIDTNYHRLENDITERHSRCGCTPSSTHVCNFDISRMSLAYCNLRQPRTSAAGISSAVYLVFVGSKPLYLTCNHIEICSILCVLPDKKKSETSTWKTWPTIECSSSIRLKFCAAVLRMSKQKIHHMSTACAPNTIIATAKPRQ